MLALKNLRINDRNGDHSPVFVTAETGNVIYRMKMGTVIGVQHPGVILGTDKWGTKWVVHNHYKNKKAAVVKFEEFTEGEQAHPYPVKIKYDGITIAGNALKAVQNNKAYHWLTNNCQHLVEQSANSTKRSQTIEDITDAATIFGAILTVAGALSGNKQLVTAGATTAGLGLFGKGLSR